MGLNKFLPNRTLIWKEWRSTLVSTAILGGFVTFASSFMLIEEILNYWGKNPPGDPYVYFPLGGGVIGFVFVALTIMLAAGLMGQERDRNTFNLLLAMPYSRRDIIYNKFVFGLGQLIVVFGLNALVMTVLILANADIQFTFGPAEIWVWTWHNIVVLSFVFAFTMLISTVSGTALGNKLLSMIFLFFPAGILELININIQYWSELRGLSEALLNWGMLLTVPLYIMVDEVMAHYNLPLVYGVLIMLVGGLYKLTQHLFARNQLENNGEVLVFEQLEGFFKLGVTVCFALLGGLILTTMLNLEQPAVAAMVYLLVGGVFWLLVSGLIKWRKPA